MRVALHFPDGSVSPFREARIGSWTHPLTGEAHGPEEIAQAYLSQAQARYPDATAVIELPLIEDGEVRWVKADEVPDGAVLSEAGSTHEQEFTVEQAQEAE